MASEYLVLDAVKSLLKGHGKCVGLRVSEVTGMPDMIACIGGRFVGIEVKDDIDGPYSLTKAQKMRLRAIVSAGGVACVVDKHNLPDFIEFVDQLADDPFMEISEWGFRNL